MATDADKALFLMSLRDLRDMVIYSRNLGEESSASAAERAYAYRGALNAIRARIDGMLDAWEADIATNPPAAVVPEDSGVRSLEMLLRASLSHIELAEMTVREAIDKVNRAA